MRGLASEEVEGVGEEVKDGSEGAGCSLGAAGEVE
jgi:hypothetical protein